MTRKLNLALWIVAAILAVVAGRSSEASAG
jgi:hypothetical protein